MKRNYYLAMFVFIMLTCFFSDSKAQIVYTDVKPDSVINGSYNLDLNNDGITDFVIQQSATILTCQRGVQTSRGIVSIMATDGNNAIINDGTGYAFALNYASAIVPDSQWSAVSQVLFNTGTTCTSTRKGYWVVGQNDQYLGLRFTKSNKTYYGWARLYAGGSTVSLRDYAYDTIANQTIFAGQGGSTVFPQTAPAIQWQKSLGGSSDDFAYSVKQTLDGGYIVAGTSYSNDGDVTGGVGGVHNFWVVKLNSSGAIEWQKNLPHTANAGAFSIQQTADGGYIVAGYSDNSGFITDNHGGYDCLIIKLTSVGDIEWQKSLGGGSDDGATSIQQTADGGYIVAGSSGSNDGDVSGNHGGSDCWAVKLNRVGSIEWQKCLGGSGSDVANSIKQTTDGGYIVAGTTNSQNGNVTGWHQGFTGGGDLTNDYWIVKLNSSGTIEWQKSLGGTGDENAYSVQQAVDGGYVVVGWSDSNDGDVTGNHGGTDCWMVKLNSTGAIEWQESLGSSAATEYAASVQQTVDGGYVVAGISVSNDGDVSGNHGGIGDYWIVKLNNIGNVQWQKCLGGSGSGNDGNGRDVANSIEQTTDGGYIIAGNSGSNDGDASGNHGGFDYWIVKLSSDFTLPIQLISFTGTLDNSIAKLNWQSGTEDNFKQYELAKSTDGKNFTIIATIAAKGSNSDYTYTTLQKESVAFYRLKITDIDAKFTYSKVVSLTQNAASVSIKISPIPAHDVVTITGAENFATVQFIDVNGRIIKQFGKMQDNSFPVTDLAKGVYFIRLVSGNDSRIFKIIKY